MIVSSFQSQYGIRLSREIHDMPWLEFKQLLCGISSDTALGKTVSIRAENDKETLKHFTRDQHRIRSEWRRRKGKVASQKEADAAIEQFRQMFLSMAGGGK